MKLFLLLAITVASSLALPSIDEFHKQWNQFKLTHKKTYSEGNEELKRINIFKDNLKKIEDHNKRYEAGEVTYVLGVTQFADITEEEFLEYLNSSRPKSLKGTKKYVRALGAAAPEEIDWREEGAVAPVIDQGQCGGGWTDSVTGALEAQNFLKVGELISLSEQELLDCVVFPALEYAFEYAIENGVTSEEEYPSDGCSSECRRGDKPAVVTATDYVYVKEGSEEDLQIAVGTVGPVASTIAASTQWQLYVGGILDDPSCTADGLNHAVLNVGYGSEADVDYWILRNSWGTGWGESGYIRIARNNANECGVATEAIYPVL